LQKNQKNTTAVQIVVDTNVFINAIGTQSPYRWIFDKILSGDIILCISNDIFFEYWEVLEAHTNSQVAENIANFLAVTPSVKLIAPFIKWELIETDPDDNKFVDCSISAGAECIITHDKHFAVLKDVPFPSVKVFSPEDFKRIYESAK
jgi:uncharacterized protein